MQIICRHPPMTPSSLNSTGESRAWMLPMWHRGMRDGRLIRKEMPKVVKELLKKKIMKWYNRKMWKRKGATSMRLLRVLMSLNWRQSNRWMPGNWLTISTKLSMIILDMLLQARLIQNRMLLHIMLLRLKMWNMIPLTIEKHRVWIMIH